MVGMSVSYAGIPLHDAQWSVVNDTVMGGVSEADLTQSADDAMVFSGDLSLDNNGGFTSTRMTLDNPDWSSSNTLVLRVEGDGREYIATLRARDRRLRRVYYRAMFQTERDTELQVTIPFSDFKAYAYGTPVPSAPPLSAQLTRLGSVGFMLADKNPGEFKLKILEISPPGSADLETVPAIRDPAGIATLFSTAIDDGVPLFNGGDAARCADIYQTAVVSVLLLAPDQLGDAEFQMLTDALRTAKSTVSQSDRAWILRRAMDGVMSGMSSR